MKSLGEFTHWQRMSSANTSSFHRAVARSGSKQIRKAHTAQKHYKPASIGERGKAGLKGHKIRWTRPDSDDEYDPSDLIPLSQRMRELPWPP